MTIKRFALAVGLLAVLAGSALAQAPTNDSSGGGQGRQKSLYARLGGYDAIAAVVDDFVARLAADKRLGKFFVGHSEDTLKKIRQHVIDQLCAGAGGPCVYTGRDMKTSHHGLGINEGDWDVSVKHLVATLDKFHVPKAEKDELLAFVGTLKKDIVEK